MLVAGNHSVDNGMNFAANAVLPGDLSALATMPLQLKFSGISLLDCHTIHRSAADARLYIYRYYINHIIYFSTLRETNECVSKIGETCWQITNGG